MKRTHHSDVNLYLLVCPFLIKLFVFRCFYSANDLLQDSTFKVET